MDKERTLHGCAAWRVMVPWTIRCSDGPFFRKSFEYHGASDSWHSFWQSGPGWPSVCGGTAIPGSCWAAD
eukprot:14378064-Alexandrium_andersonii.AAC.1